MNTTNNETSTKQDTSESVESVSQSRRSAVSKLAYTPPAIAALLVSKSAAAQASTPPRFTPPVPPQ